MFRILPYVFLLVIAAAGVTLLASLLQSPGYDWAYRVCNSAYGLCDHRVWLGAIIAVAGGLYFVLQATET